MGLPMMQYAFRSIATGRLPPLHLQKYFAADGVLYD